MNKKFVIGIVILFFGAVIVPSINATILKTNVINNIIKDGGELDQYQLEMDSSGLIGKSPNRPYKYYIVAQDFTPTKKILTSVELMVSKTVTTSYDLTLAIRDNLWESDLTSISINPESIPTDVFDWIEFDFDNIKVTPGKTYYIVCSTIDTSNNWYAWGVKMDDVYPNGSIQWSEDGQEWNFDTGIDATFKTYGTDNNPPNRPDIDGPPTGKPGIEYTFCITPTDPDGDSLYVKWDWDDGEITPWLGPYESGVEICESHAWSKSGRYIIEVTVRDDYGASVTGYLEIIIPRNRAIINTYWLEFIDMFPILQKILDIIL